MRHAIPIALLALAGAAQAHDYPTTDRVEYVLECMRANGGEQQYIYKCSCVIDEIAKKLTYDEYVEGAMVLRYQGAAGERMSVFRDPDEMKDTVKRYRAVLGAARKECLLSK